MKRRLFTAAIVTAALSGLLLTLLVLVPAGAQMPVVQPSAPPGMPVIEPPAAPRKPTLGLPHYPPGMRAGATAQRRERTAQHLANTIFALRNNLSVAKTDQEKEAAAKELEKALTEFFDADMKSRLEELQTLKTQLAELEAYLKKREAAKEEIVNLQLEAYKNEAEGLGFFLDGRQPFMQRHLPPGARMLQRVPDVFQPDVPMVPDLPPGHTDVPR